MFRLFKLLEPIFIFVVWSFGVYLALFRPFSVLILILAVFFFPRFTLIPCLLGFSFGVLTIPKFEVSSKRYVGRLEGILISDPKSVRKGLLSAYANTNRGAKYIKIPVLGWKGVDYLEEGAKIFGFATCVPLKPTYNPFTFNFQLTLKGVKEVCKFKNFSIVRNSKSTFKQLKINSDRKLESIKNYFGVKNLVLSFSLGRTLDLSLHHDKIFRDSGLYHLLVISGYQLMIIVTLVSRFVNFFRYKMNLFCLKSMICLKVICFSAIGFYLFLIEIDKPIIRAMIFLILLEIRNFFLKFNAILGSAYLVCSFDPGAQFSMSFLLTFAALLGFSLAQFYEGYKYLFASSIYASILSSFVLFIYGFNPNGSSIIFNLIFSVPFSVISTLGGILAIGEFFFLGTDTLWFLVCCLTFALVWGLGVLSPLLNIEFIYVIPIGILALVSLNYQYWNLALLRKLFRRQKCKFHA